MATAPKALSWLRIRQQVGAVAQAASSVLSAASGFAAACEALLIGQRFGLEPETMVDILNVSTGRNFATEVVLKNEILTGRFGGSFALGLMAKDVGIAANLGREDAHLLAVPPGSAALSIERVAYLAGGQPVEFTRSFYRGDIYDFVAELTLG